MPHHDAPDSDRPEGTPSPAPAFGDPTITNPTTPSPATRKRRWLPRWPWLFALGLLTLGLVVWSFDEMTPDPSGLVIEPLSLPDHENGILLLIKTAQDATRTIPLNATESERLTKMARGKSWDDSQATALATAFAPFAERLADAVNKPHSQLPRPTSLTAAIIPVTPLLQLANFSLVVARKRLREGNPDAAIQTALIAARAGKLIQSSNGVLISYLIGAALKNSAIEVIQDAVQHPNVSTNQLRETLVEFPALRDRGDDFANCLRGERYFADMSLEKLGNEGPESWDLPDMPTSVSRALVRIPVLYKRNKTARLYYQQLRGAMRLIHADYATQTAESDKLKDTLSPHSFSRFNPDNLIGRMVLDNTIPVWSAILSHRLRAESLLSVHEAFVAVQLYQRDHGAPPATLGVLVPDYIPAVPEDYFDNESVRYSAELGVIWSTGKKGLVITSADQRIPTTEVVLWLVKRKPLPEEDEPDINSDASNQPPASSPPHEPSSPPPPAAPIAEASPNSSTFPAPAPTSNNSTP